VAAQTHITDLVTERTIDMADDADRKEPSGAEKMFGDFAPALVRFTDDVLFGQVWARPELSPKERSLVTVPTDRPGATGWPRPKPAVHRRRAGGCERHRSRRLSRSSWRRRSSGLTGLDLRFATGRIVI
jgi:hypothetical protein